MKKFLLFAILMFAANVLVAQSFQLEEFNDGQLPQGWDVASGMQVQSYSRPTNCTSDFGLQTPGIGGNNPARVLTSPYTFNSSTPVISVGFTIYIFNANLNCGTNKSLP